MKNNRMHWPLDRLVRRPPVTDEALAQFRRISGEQLPDDYIAFLRTTNGGEGNIGSAHVRFWGIEELLPMTEQYKIKQYMPGVLAFGTDGGGEAIAFDTRQRIWSVIVVEFTVLTFEDSIQIGTSFSDFVSRLDRLGVAALSRDSRP